MAKRRIWTWTGALTIALVFSIGFGLLNWFQDERGWYDWLPYKLELKLLDQLFIARGPIQTDSKVVMAAIDEKSLEHFGLWGTWDRRVIAQAIDNLLEAGAEVVAFDIVFSNPSTRADTQKGRELERVVAAADLEGSADFLDRTGDEAKAALQNTAAGVEKARLPAAVAAQLPDQVRHAHNSGIATAIAGVDDARKKVDLAQQRAQALRGKTGALLNVISGEASGKTGDDVFVETIDNRSGNLIMGFIAMSKPDEKRYLEEASAAFELIGGSAIDTITASWVVPKEGEEVAQPDPQTAITIDARLKVPAVNGGFIVPLKIFADKAQNFGYFSLDPDTDGVIRRVPLVYRYENKLVPSLSLTAASFLLEASPHPVTSSYYSQALQSVSFAVSNDIVDKLCSRRVAADDKSGLATCKTGFGEGMQKSVIVDLPTTPRGEMLVNYYGPMNTTFARVSMADIVANTFDPALVRGRVVLVAATAMATYDQRVTPFNSFVPGGEIHAAAVQNIIDGKFLRRPPWAGALEIAVMLLLGLALGVVVRRFSIAVGIAVTGAVLVAYYSVNTFVLFPRGLWFWTVFPTLQIVFTWAGITVFGYLTEGRDKRRIASQFGKYVAPEYVKKLIENPEVIGMPGEERELTVLFSDIRGFTTMSERLAPEELTRFLNEYLTPMTHVLQRHGGTLDKYMGDAIMAFFGAPNPLPDHPLQGCMTAIEMLQELDRLRQKWRAEGKPELDIGIGLNTGKMRVGDMGSEAMRNYTVLGDNVNLGSRLEGLNKEYGTNTIASEATFRAAGSQVFGRELDFVAVKGKREPVRIFEVTGLGEPSDWQKNLIATFEQGLAAYRKQEWESAIELFRKCLLLKKEATGQPDKTSHTYLERVRVLQQTPPGADWDGVWRMTKK